MISYFEGPYGGNGLRRYQRNKAASIARKLAGARSMCEVKDRRTYDNALFWVRLYV